MEKQIKVVGFISKNSKKPVHALVLDLGYRKVFLSFDTSLVAEALGISVVELYGKELPYEINI